MSRHQKKQNLVSTPVEKTRILLVDDEEDITHTLRLTLEREGMVVTVFNDPREALKKFKAAKYDLAVLDIRMPGMNGFELYNRIRKMDSKLRVCFLTAFELYEDDLVINKISKSEIDCIIKKPIQVSEMMKKIKTVLEQ